MDGSLVTAWTIRIALLALLVSVLLGTVRPIWSVSTGVRRAIWTFGCLVFLAHIAAGMHFFHGWDHGHAYDDTAHQTYQTLGVRFGGGIFVNHLMAIVWCGDVLWWWLLPVSYTARSPRWEQAIVGFFLFIAFNGLVVFKQGMLRVAGIVGFSGLTLAWLVVQRLVSPKQQLDVTEP